MILYILSLILMVTNKADCKSDHPNIVFFMADDWGFNDVGYHLNTDTQTPFIDEIATKESLIVEKYYGYHACTITRSALLTGRYSMRFGMQSFVITYESNYALTLKESLLAEEFQLQGYQTHMVGKWHLGHMLYDYTPTHRGFDTFFGYYGGELHYYTHLGIDDYYNGFDLRDDMNPYCDSDHNESNMNSLYLLSERANKIISDSQESEEEKPFFLYIGWQGSHSPSECDMTYMDGYSQDLSSDEIEENSDRLYFQGQTTMTDYLFKHSIIDELKKDSELWDNTLVIFASDNGGAVGYGDNSPLRGGKGTIWEGGVRLPLFITGGYLPEHLRGVTFDQYAMHVTDWYPTLLAAANLNVLLKDVELLDGTNVWDLLMHADSIGSDDIEDDDIQDIRLEHDTRYMLINVNNYECTNEVCGALIYGSQWKLVISNELNFVCYWERTFEKNTHQDILECGPIPDDINFDLVNDTDCNKCSDDICLFDLVNDPCEYYDVSEQHVELTNKLYTQLKVYYDEQAAPLFDEIGDVDDTIQVKPNNMSNDTCVDVDNQTLGFWGPWMDASVDWRELEFEIYLDQFYESNSESNSMSGSISNENMRYLVLIVSISIILLLHIIVILSVWFECLDSDHDIKHIILCSRKVNDTEINESSPLLNLKKRIIIRSTESHSV